MIELFAIKCHIKDMKKQGYNGLYITMTERQANKFKKAGYKVIRVKAMQYRIEWTDEQNEFIK